jgi:hypothetical protein
VSLRTHVPLILFCSLVFVTCSRNNIPDTAVLTGNTTGAGVHVATNNHHQQREHTNISRQRQQIRHRIQNFTDWFPSHVGPFGDGAPHFTVSWSRFLTRNLDFSDLMMRKHTWGRQKEDDCELRDSSTRHNLHLLGASILLFKLVIRGPGVAEVWVQRHRTHEPLAGLINPSLSRTHHHGKGVRQKDVHQKQHRRTSRQNKTATCNTTSGSLSHRRRASSDRLRCAGFGVMRISSAHSMPDTGHSWKPAAQHHSCKQHRMHHDANHAIGHL